MEEALASLVVGQKLRLSNLEKELQQDAKNKHAAFEKERVRRGGYRSQLLVLHRFGHVRA